VDANPIGVSIVRGENALGPHECPTERSKPNASPTPSARHPVKREFTRQSEQENRIYYEPRCIEGNFALPGLMRGARMEEAVFAEGRGPNPATKDKAIGNSGVAEDPLEIPR
jgi:hypothetical protein